MDRHITAAVVAAGILLIGCVAALRHLARRAVERRFDASKRVCGPHWR